jgi:hypothetical protein
MQGEIIAGGIYEHLMRREEAASATIPVNAMPAQIFFDQVPGFFTDFPLALHEIRYRDVGAQRHVHSIEPTLFEA